MSMLIDAAQARWLDQHASACGLSGMVLMEAAAAKASLVASDILSRAPDRPARRPDNGPAVLVLCGRGNNGGDGIALARHLRALGHRVLVFMAAGDRDLPPESTANLHAWCQTGGLTLVAESLDHQSAWDKLSAVLQAAPPPALIVDALLGIGTTRPPSGGIARAIELLAAHRPLAPVLALDVPTGLNSDTGLAYSPNLRADFTVTFGLPKIGLFTGDGPALAGEIVVASIGLPAMSGQSVPLPDVPAGSHLATTGFPATRTYLMTDETARAALPARPLGAHKGDAGSALIIAGSSGMTGAAVLAAHAAVRGGAGLVHLATPASLQPVVAAALAEAVTIPLPEAALRPDAVAVACQSGPQPGCIGPDAIPAILQAASAATAVALGPGLGGAPTTVDAVRRLVSRLELPLVLDADGLNAFAGDTAALAARPAQQHALVLTPHPGELARLLDTSIASIQDDRVGAARRAARAARAICLLKGKGTVVAAPDGEAWIIPGGNPGMASGGMGDVLTGLLAALLAGWARSGAGRPATTDRPSLPVLVAAAGLIHAVAGDLAAREVGNIGLKASDVAERLPRARDLICDPAAGLTTPALIASLKGVSAVV